MLLVAWGGVQGKPSRRVVHTSARCLVFVLQGPVAAVFRHSFAILPRRVPFSTSPSGEGLQVSKNRSHRLRLELHCSSYPHFPCTNPRELSNVMRGTTSAPSKNIPRSDIRQPGNPISMRTSTNTSGSASVNSEGPEMLMLEKCRRCFWEFRSYGSTRKRAGVLNVERLVFRNSMAMCG